MHKPLANLRYAFIDHQDLEIRTEFDRTDRSSGRVGERIVDDGERITGTVGVKVVFASSSSGGTAGGKDASGGTAPLAGGMAAWRHSPGGMAAKSGGMAAWRHGGIVWRHGGIAVAAQLAAKL